MVTDDELLAAVRSAGPPGTESHREACRLYRQSVTEWRAGHVRWREGYAARASARLSDAIAEAAGRRGPCGSHYGYNRHRDKKTPVCPRCEVAERAYQRTRKRAQRRAKAERAWAWAEAA